MPLQPNVEAYKLALLAKLGHAFPPSRPQQHCQPGQVRQPPRYILVIGAGYSGTGGIAQLLTSLGLPVSHENVHPDRIKTSGLSSWPSTVLGNFTGAISKEPGCRQLSVFLQVRHPRSVVRSALGSAWNFKLRYTHLLHLSGYILDVKDYVPQKYAEVWPQLSTEIKALLWWSSFCLLAEMQLGSTGFAWRMEDIFHMQNAEPVQAVLAASGWTMNESKIQHVLSNLVPYNVHAAHGESLQGWQQLLAVADARNNTSLRSLERQAILVASYLAVRYGYTTRR